MIKVSIIIPHFNSPVLLEKLLSSIPEREDIQVIVVDDNSTKYPDEYGRVVQRHKDAVEFCRNTTGIQSAGACRNTGLSKAKGKWILFADADDYFTPDMYDIISRYFDSEYDMIMFCPTSVHLGTGKKASRHIRHEERIKAYLADPSRKNYMALGRTTAIWSKLIRRSVVEENDIRCSTSMHGNDVLCSRELFWYCRNKTAVMDVIYCITQGEASLTRAKTSRAFEDSVNETVKGCLFDKQHYNKSDYNAIDISGAEILVNGMKKHMGFKKIFWGYRTFRKNKVRVIPRRLLNPKNVIAYIKRGYLV